METDECESMETTETKTPSPQPPPMHTTVTLDDDGYPVLLSYGPLQSTHCKQITPEQYREQATTYTQQAVMELQASPEYRRHTETCHR